MNIKRIHFLILFLFLSCLSIPSQAQKEYFDGFVVLNSGDTLHGKIQDRNINQGDIYDRIRFKGKGKKKYRASDLISYTVESTTFESRWFFEDAAFFKFRYYTSYGRGEKVFLRVNVKGPVTCYTKEFTDDDSSFIDGFELFLKEGDDYFQRANQGVFGLKEKKLMEYFSDCPRLVEMIEFDKVKTANEVAEYYNRVCADN